jgi:hypothetical protein
MLSDGRKEGEERNKQKEEKKRTNKERKKRKKDYSIERMYTQPSLSFPPPQSVQFHECIKIFNRLKAHFVFPEPKNFLSTPRIGLNGPFHSQNCLLWSTILNISNTFFFLYRLHINSSFWGIFLTFQHIDTIPFCNLKLQFLSNILPDFFHPGALLPTDNLRNIFQQLQHFHYFQFLSKLLFAT